jgi:hypothetical protein
MTALVLASRTDRMVQLGITGHAIMQTPRAVFFGLLSGWCLALSATLFSANAHAASARDTTTAKPAPPAPASSTIYIIRQKEFRLLTLTLDIFVDEQKAGELAAGTYLVVRRPAGHHSVAVPGLLEGDLDTVGGRSYFIEYGPFGYGPGAQFAQSLLMGGAGTRGTPLPGSGMTAGFYLLDEKQGGEQIAGLKNVTR